MDQLTTEVIENAEALTQNHIPGTGHFVAINYITCKDHYRERFEELFKSRKKAIDRIPGFIRMEVLRPGNKNDSYLVVSYWESAEGFKTWTKSEEFLEGHKRGFEDMKKYKENGEEPPMQSTFKTYEIFAT